MTRGDAHRPDHMLGLSTVLVAPTSRSRRPRALDLARLGAFAGRLTPQEQRAVDDALVLTLALR